MKNLLLSVVFCILSFGAFAALTADFSAETWKIRPELHSSGFGPTIC